MDKDIFLLFLSIDILGSYVTVWKTVPSEARVTRDTKVSG